MFPNISHIDELRPHVLDKPEIRFVPQPDGTTVVCYVVSDNKTFDNAWARECRGITFDANGYLVCRPLHKFFNVGENDESRYENLPWTELTSVTVKLDGSMLTPYLAEGTLRWKTKKTAESEVARMAAAYAAGEHQLEAFCRDALADGYTPVFEFTAPEARIVVAYPRPELTLLHLRHMKTGEYVSLRNPDGTPTYRALEIEMQYSVRVVSAFPTDSWNSLHTGLSTVKNLEGYVLAFGQRMYKAKGDWYRAAHPVVSFVRERDVAAWVADERLDDVLVVLRELGASLAAVEEVSGRVVRHILSIQEEVETLASRYAGAHPKVVAHELATHPLRGLVLQLHRDLPVDYLTHFRKHHVKQYPLTQLPTRNINVDFDG